MDCINAEDGYVMSDVDIFVLYRYELSVTFSVKSIADATMCLSTINAIYLYLTW